MRSTTTDVAQTAADLRLVIGRLVRRLRAVGDGAVTATQLSALANLDEHGTLRLRDLARHEGVKPPTATRLVDVLVGRGLVERSPDPGDARGTLLSLTEAGRDLVAVTRANRTAALAEAMGRLDPAEAEQLAAAVPLLHRLLSELPAPTGQPAAG